MVYPTAQGVWGLRFLWDHFSERQVFAAAHRTTWVDQFFFCLLGGYSIPYELNKSAFNVLKNKGCFRPDLEWENSELIMNSLVKELATPQFAPLKKNGEFRSYRFPNSKANVICQAGNWLKASCDFNIEQLIEKDPRRSRDKFLRCPGIGYKTASWFLRNIGFGQNLAILDVHICRTLKEFQIIPSNLNVPSDYLLIEKIYCETCVEIGARADSLDLILWEWARGGASDKRQSQ